MTKNRMDLEIHKVNEENKKELLGLQVALNQQNFIETIAECLEEAEEWKEYRPVGLYIGEVPVGFAMYGSLEDSEGGFNLWIDRILIDERFQRRGYGRRFMELLIERVLREYGEQPIYLSVYANNTAALHMYETLDFVLIGEHDANGEEIMRKGS